jgi:hypothetical protein
MNAAIGMSHIAVLLALKAAADPVLASSATVPGIVPSMAMVYSFVWV